MTQNDTLNPRQIRAIEALLDGQTITEAAETAGVARQTLTRWLRQPVFKQALNEAMTEALNDLSCRLVGLGDSAANSLQKVLKSATARDADQIRAAAVVLRGMQEMRELAALENRLAVLEAALLSGGNNAT